MYILIYCHEKPTKKMRTHADTAFNGKLFYTSDIVIEYYQKYAMLANLVNLYIPSNVLFIFPIFNERAFPTARARTFSAPGLIMKTIP